MDLYHLATFLVHNKFFVMIFKTLRFLFVDYDDDNVAADGYYDDNIDEQRIDEAISSHDPTTEYQISTLYNKFI